MSDDSAVTLTPSPTTEEIAAATTQQPQMPVLYYNYCRAAASFYDVRLHFGQANILPNGQVTFQEQMSIALSLEFAKTLEKNLSQIVSAYEEKFGKLRAEPQIPSTLTQTPIPPNIKGQLNLKKKQK